MTFFLRALPHPLGPLRGSTVYLRGLHAFPWRQSQLPLFFVFRFCCKQTWALVALAKEVDLPPSVVKKKMMLWVNQGIVVEVPGPSYRLVQDQVNPLLPVRTCPCIILSGIFFWSCWCSTRSRGRDHNSAPPIPLCAPACHCVAMFVLFLFSGSGSSGVRRNGCDVDGGKHRSSGIGGCE